MHCTSKGQGWVAQYALNCTVSQISLCTKDTTHTYVATHTKIGNRVLTCPPVGTLLVNLIKHEETPRQPSLTRAVEKEWRNSLRKTQLTTAFVHIGIETLLCVKNTLELS